MEDEDAIAFAFRAAVEEAYIPVIVYRVSNGKQAMEYLYSHQHPDLVFLDVNRPKVTGWEVLRAMRADESLRPIPVVIFTTSSRPADIEQAHALGAQHFIRKPSTFTGLVVELRPPTVGL